MADRVELWRDSGLRQFQIVWCVVTEHRGRFGVDVEVTEPAVGFAGFIDFVMLAEPGVPVTPGDFPAVGTVLELVDFMEAAREVISGDKYVTAGSSRLTDGVWVWRLDLAYYLDRYHLGLDPGFLLCVVEHDGECQKVPTEAIRVVTENVKETFFK